jgi:anti-sigma factor RsiW
MTDAACPDRILALHAMLDGELDAIGVIGLEDHLRLCPACRREFDRLDRLRGLLRAPELRDAAPKALSARTESWPCPRGRRNRSAHGWAEPSGGDRGQSGLLADHAGAEGPALRQALVDSHIRSLQAGHLTDVSVSDRHVVKPWFNGRLAFAPPVPDLSADGFALSGGRLDVIEGHDVAVLVYRRHLHTINLFVRSGPSSSAAWRDVPPQAGFGIERWQMDGLEFLAVSDLDP